MNKRLNKFSFYSAKYWKGKIRSHLNDIYVVSISFLFFLDLISILSSGFNFHSILYRFNDLLYRFNDIISRLNEIIFVLISGSNFLVSISFLINIGKEMSLPGFRKYDLHDIHLSRPRNYCNRHTPVIWRYIDHWNTGIHCVHKLYLSESILYKVLNSKIFYQISNKQICL